MSLVLKIFIQLLLALGVLFLMGFLGLMIYAFCFMIHEKGESENS